MTKPQKSAPPPDAVALWVRQRRQELGLSLREVANALEVSPAFVSMLESGRKRPGAQVAARLARVLREKEGMLLKWVEAYRPKSLEAAKRTAREIEDFLSRDAQLRLPEKDSTATVAGVAQSLPESSELAALGAGGAPDEFAQQVRTLQHLELTLANARRAEARAPTERSVPLLLEGADPDDSRANDASSNITKFLDLGDLAAGTLIRPFAYQLSELGALRARDSLSSGDIVVITRDSWPLSPAGIYAVRLETGVVLSRLVLKDNFLLLIAAEVGAAGFELLPIEGTTQQPKQLLGRIALMIRQFD